MHRWKFVLYPAALFIFLRADLLATDYFVTLETDSSLSTGGSGSGTSGDFRYVLNQILNHQAQGISSSPHTITFSIPTVTLGALPPPINLFGSDTITIGNSSGSPTTIDGGSLYRPFFIRQGTVTLQNLIIQNGLAQAGNGGEDGGGGGMGAGGALFVDDADVTLIDVTLISNVASAGLGDMTTGGFPGGGGGLGGSGGAYGGGGGYSGDGGLLGGGGGVGEGGAGGGYGGGQGLGGGGGAILGAVGGEGATDATSSGSAGSSVAGYVFGGGGGGGGQTSGTGGAGGGTMPGAGNVNGTGGGGGYNSTGINGGVGGGGGSGQTVGSISGGNGGDGGGGGGLTGTGGYGGGGGVGAGQGAFGGGGGGVGGSSAFGGGGGGGGTGGQGGFGGGGGGGGSAIGQGGVGATNGATSGAGGDGAALGGAIFLNTGSIEFQGNCSTTTNTVTPNGGGGAFVGSDIFGITDAQLTFAPGIGNTIILSGSVGDDSNASIQNGGSWNPGSGNGLSLLMQGPGTLVLEGSNSYFGGTTILGGEVFVNGEILEGVIVNSGATVGGNGTILGGGTINGTISPGSPIGTLTVDTSSGSLTLDSSAVTNIGIDPNNGSQLLIAGRGVAILAGTVNVTQQETSGYGTSGQYEIVNGSYFGEFDPVVTGGLPGYQFSLSYVSPSVYLLYQYMGWTQIPTSNLQGNALIVANYINNDAPSSALSPFSELSGSSLQTALNSVSPSRNAFGSYITQQTAFSLSVLLSHHNDALRFKKKRASESPLMTYLMADASDSVQEEGKKRPEVSDSVEYSGWISGFGEYARQAAQEQNPSFHYLSEAALGGFEGHGINRRTVGGALGYVHTHFTEAENQGNGTINGYFGSLYGNGWIGSFYFSPAIWAIFNQIQNRRNIVFVGVSEKAKGEIFVWQFLPHLEMGYERSCSWGEIIPFTTLDWAINWQRRYQEEGGGIYSVRGDAKSSSMLRSETGLKLSEKWTYDWGAFLLREKLSYVFEKSFGTGSVSAALSGTPSFFTVTGFSHALNLGDIALDFAVAIGEKKTLSISLGYEGEFGSNYWSNQLMLTIDKDF